MDYSIKMNIRSIYIMRDYVATTDHASNTLGTCHDQPGH